MRGLISPYLHPFHYILAYVATHAHTHNCGNTQRHTSVTCMVAIPKNQNSHTRTCIYGVFYICTHCIRRTFVHICFQLVPFGNRVASTKCLQGKAWFYVLFLIRSLLNTGSHLPCEGITAYLCAQSWFHRSTAGSMINNQLAFVKNWS